MERFERLDYEASELKYGAGRIAAILAVASLAMIFSSVYDTKLFQIDFGMINFWTLGLGISLLAISIVGFIFACKLVNGKTAERKDQYRQMLDQAAHQLGTKVDDSGTEPVLVSRVASINHSR